MRLLYLLMCICLFSCKKEFGDLGGNEKLEGQALISDPYSSRPIKEFYKEATIKIKYAGASSYLYVTSTDKEGRFKFTNLTKEKNYEVFVDTIINGTPYAGITAFTNFSTQSDGLIDIVPDISKISILCITVTTPVSPVNNVTVHRFLNEQYFNALDFTNQLDEMSTDNVGKVFYRDIPPGTYYFYSEVDISGILKKGKSITVPLTGFVNEKLELE